MASTFQPISDQAGMVLQEIARIRQELASPPTLDTQELGERTAAAQAYAGETPGHFVRYVQECVRTTSRALRDVRLQQRECWQMYQEQPPPNYADKAEWQSQAILPKPYAAVQFAVAMVQAAFSPTFLSIKDEPARTANLFWSKLMEQQLNEQHANFVVRFTDASEMGFAVGQSMEMIPIWDATRNALTYSLVEPWKVYRDPDALNREPQSGLYWIHEEWVDYHVLRDGEQQGRYKNTQGLRQVAPTDSHDSNAMMHQGQQARLRSYVYQRNTYRTAILTQEFWGTVLSPTGEMLLPSATFTVAGDRLIADPAPSPYSTLRWPGVGFSPLPHLLRFEGRSLLQSVRSLWYLMCNLLSLHADYQNWIVNPMREINIRALANQDDMTDLDPYPGRLYEVRDTVSGQPVVRTVDQRFVTGDILANEGWLDQVFQRGSLVTDVVQGLPGYRQEITARESAQHLAQSRSVFTKMGMNEDVGAVQAILAGMETLRLDITPAAVLTVFPMEELLEMFGDRGDGLPTIFDPQAPSGVVLPPLQGTVHVSGLQNLLQETEELAAIERLIVPMATHPVFSPYIRPYNLAKAIEARANLEDEHLLIDEKEAEALMQQQQQQQQDAQALQQRLVQAQVTALEEKGALDARKADIEEQKLQVDAQMQQVELLQAAAETEASLQLSADETERSKVELARIQAELMQVAQQLKMDEAALALDVAKVEGQLAKIAEGIRVQQQQLALKRDELDQRFLIEQQKIAVQREAIAAQERAAKARPAGGSD